MLQTIDLLEPNVPVLYESDEFRYLMELSTRPDQQRDNLPN